MSVADNRDAARAIALAVAPLLAGWQANIPDDPDKDWGDIVRGDGARIRVRVGGWRRDGRVEFYGCWPTYTDGRIYFGGKRLTITCDAKRAPKALAREIARRLLPTYDHEYAAAVAAVREGDDASDEARMVADRIAQTIGGRISGRTHLCYDEVHIAGGPDAVHRLRVQPAHRSSWRDAPVRLSFEVHGLDVESAARVLEIISAAEREQVSEVRVATPSRADIDELLQDKPARRARMAAR